MNLPIAGFLNFGEGVVVGSGAGVTVVREIAEFYLEVDQKHSTKFKFYSNETAKSTLLRQIQ